MSDRQVNDRKLIKRYLTGDEGAFRILYERYRRPLYSYLNEWLPGQPSTVDDLYQDTWVRVLDSLPRYRHRSRFGGWLFRIAHNLAMDHFRSHRGHRETPDRDLETLPDDNPLPWRRLAEAEQSDALHRAVDQLPDEQREVVLLRQRGLSFREIADVQGTGINTALGRMHYALRNLRRQLENPADYAETPLAEVGT